MTAALESWFVRALAVAVGFGTAQFAIRPMASYRAIELGASTAEVGVIAGAYGLLAIVLAVPVGRLVDRLGEGRVMVGGAALMTLVAFWLLGLDDLVSLALSQALLGLGQLAVNLAVLSLLAGGGRPTDRDMRFGYFTVAASVGGMFGPALAGWAATSSGAVAGFTVALWAAAVTLAFSVSLLLKGPATHDRRDQPQRPADPPLRAIASVARIPTVPRALLMALVVLTATDILTAYLPVYGEARGLAVSTVTTLLAIRAAATIASRMVMLILVRSLGRRRVLLHATSLAALSILAIPLSGSVPVLIALVTLAGFGLGIGAPLTLTWLAARTPVHIRATALGLRITGNRIGQLSLPIAVGLLATATGIGAVFVTTGLLLLGGASMLFRIDIDDDPTADANPPGDGG